MKLTSKERLYFKNNKVLNEHVLKLLVRHVKKYRRVNVKKRGYQKWSEAKHPPMDEKLAELILILTQKIVNSPKFCFYTEDWKEDCVSNASLLLMKYCHNFKLDSNNAIGYLYGSIENAIIQELNLKKKHCERFSEISINNLKESDLIVKEDFNPNIL